MSQELQQRQESGGTTISAQAMESALLKGDLSKLSDAERLNYYRSVCESLRLNPLTKPFAYIQLNGKLQLYALRECTEQLRQIHNVSVTIVSREVVEDCYVVTARAALSTGRQDESIGATPIGGLKGEARANAMMKAETKAKRRVTLSICGLAFLDETEAPATDGHFVHVSDSGALLPAPTPSLADDIKANPPKGKKSTTPFDVMKYFGELKKRYHKIGMDDFYYQKLGEYGIAHCNEFPNTPEGIQQARDCFKAMQLDVANCEAAAAKDAESAQ